MASTDTTPIDQIPNEDFERFTPEPFATNKGSTASASKTSQKK